MVATGRRLRLLAATPKVSMDRLLGWLDRSGLRNTGNHLEYRRSSFGTPRARRRDAPTRWTGERWWHVIRQRYVLDWNAITVRTGWRTGCGDRPDRFADWNAITVRTGVIRSDSPSVKSPVTLSDVIRSVIRRGVGAWPGQLCYLAQS